MSVNKEGRDLIMNLKVTKMRGTVLLLALAMFLTSLTIMPVRVRAASKSYINDEEILTAGINQTIDVSMYLIKRSKATYTFTSSNKSVAKVSSKGKITAVKVGTAKIKVVEKYKGKKTTLGNVKVAVKKAVLDDLTYPIYVDEEDYTDTINFENYILYENPKATYKIFSNDTSKVKISAKGVITYANGEEGDTVKLTVKETYKGKTRTIGTASIEFTRQDNYDDDYDYDDEDYDYDEYYDDYDDE
jgi:hypothetical protein